MHFKQLAEPPFAATPINGTVIVEGECGGVVLTPEAAEKASDELWLSASIARGQQRRELRDQSS
jgi:hypothetical protein